VYEHYYAGKADAIFPPGAYQPDMFAEARAVRADEAKARKVEAAISEKISRHALARAYRVFRTSVEGKEMLILNYVRFCFRHGPGAAFLHTHPCVLPVVTAERKISNEVHRLCGLIRFASVMAADGTAVSAADSSAANRPSRLCGDQAPEGTAATPAKAGRERRAAPEILYARISPDHDVLEFIAPHFADRLKNEPFIIHDAKRGRAVIAWRRRWHITDFTDQDASMFASTASEEAYRALWREYFDAMAIKERKNTRCQRGLMPARYWQHMPEMQLP
jgi:hypothetical protein